MSAGVPLWGDWRLPCAFILTGELTPISTFPAVYTLAFFAFWLATMASSALTTLLARSPFEVNRCPLPADGRPSACAKANNAGDVRC